MFVKVFVLGRPGSGKSTAIQCIHDVADRYDISTISIKDYTILREMFEQELKRNSENRKFRPAEWDGFDVLDFSVLDEALEQLEMKVQRMEVSSSKRVEIVLIEFARSDYYKALDNFTTSFLKGSYFLFIDATLEEACIKRIHRRRKAKSSSEDRHSVSDDIMRSYYSTHNWSSTVTKLAEEDRNLQNIVEINNNGTMEEFVQKVNSFAETTCVELLIANKHSNRDTQPLNKQPQSPLPEQPVEVMSKASVVGVTS